MLSENENNNKIDKVKLEPKQNCVLRVLTQANSLQCVLSIWNLQMFHSQTVLRTGIFGAIATVAGTVAVAVVAVVANHSTHSIKIRKQFNNHKHFTYSATAVFGIQFGLADAIPYDIL